MLVKRKTCALLFKFGIGNAETEAWFIDSLEEWWKAKNLSNFILLGHSFGGYVASKYALKVLVIPLFIFESSTVTAFSLLLMWISFYVIASRAC